MKGTLYLVATPIGNLKDFSFRGKEVLSSVDVIFCEDTRRFRKLQEKMGITPQGKIFSFYKENEEKMTQKGVEFLKEGKTVAVVSDAGMPLIADPGWLLVKAAWEEKIPLVCIPGPTAFSMALVLSGFPVKNFAFWGYLPKNKKKQKKIFSHWQKMASLFGLNTFVFYESPHRLLSTLRTFSQVLGEKEIFILKEATKKHEELLRGTPKELLKLFSNNKIKGEFTLVCYLR